MDYLCFSDSIRGCNGAPVEFRGIRLVRFEVPFPITALNRNANDIVSCSIRIEPARFAQLSRDFNIAVSFRMGIAQGFVLD